MIKLKKILNESSPGFENRKFGAPLPTLEDIQTAHNAKQDLKEEYVESMNAIELDEYLAEIEKLWKAWKNGPMTERSDIKPAGKELTHYILLWMRKTFK